MIIEVINNLKDVLDQDEDRLIMQPMRQHEHFAIDYLNARKITLMTALKVLPCAHGTPMNPAPMNRAKMNRAPMNRAVWACSDELTRQHIFNVVFSWEPTSLRWGMKTIDKCFIVYANQVFHNGGVRTYMLLHRPNCETHKIWIGDLCNGKQNNKGNWQIPVSELSEVKS